MRSPRLQPNMSLTFSLPLMLFVMSFLLPTSHRPPNRYPGTTRWRKQPTLPHTYCSIAMYLQRRVGAVECASVAVVTFVFDTTECSGGATPIVRSDVVMGQLEASAASSHLCRHLDPLCFRCTYFVVVSCSSLSSPPQSPPAHYSPHSYPAIYSGCPSQIC
jgi:hypothetical protein